MASPETPSSSGALAVLRTPGFARLFGATLIGRLPLGAIGLLLILHVRDIAGSYAAGGLAAGAFAVSVGLGAPLLGRLVDRRGQATVLVPCALIGGIALSAIAALGDGAPPGAIVALAALAGASTPPLGACVRALWPALLPDRGRQDAAYALEASAQEIVYILGPLVVVGVIGAHSTALGLVACGALTIAGTLLFTLQRHSRRWRPVAAARNGLAGALASPGVRALVVVVALFGLGVGAIELSTAAAARGAGHESAVAVLLALWGAGSMAGGMVAARRGAPERPVRELARRYALLGALQLPLVVADASFVLLGALLVVAGFAIAPALAITFRVVSDVAHAGTVTESFTWMSTGITAGVAAGSVLAGALVDGLGSSAGFVLAALAGLLGAGAAIVLPGLREGDAAAPAADQFIEGSAGMRASNT